MWRPSRFAILLLLGIGLVGCQGDDLLEDERFQVTTSPQVILANDVRATVAGVEPGADPAPIGAELAETLEQEMDSPAVEGHKETYQKILAAAKELANGDASKLAEIRELAETLPKDAE